MCGAWCLRSERYASWPGPKQSELGCGAIFLASNFLDSVDQSAFRLMFSLRNLGECAISPASEFFWICGVFREEPASQRLYATNPTPNSRHVGRTSLRDLGSRAEYSDCNAAMGMHLGGAAHVVGAASESPQESHFACCTSRAIAPTVSSWERWCHPMLIVKSRFARRPAAAGSLARLAARIRTPIHAQ